jgi:hypothetical protein
MSSLPIYAGEILALSRLFRMTPSTRKESISSADQCSVGSGILRTITANYHAYAQWPPATYFFRIGNSSDLTWLPATSFDVELTLTRHCASLAKHVGPQRVE